LKRRDGALLPDSQIHTRNGTGTTLNRSEVAQGVGVMFIGAVERRGRLAITRRAGSKTFDFLIGLIMKYGKDVKRGSPHSERAGEAVLAAGERAALYRALRELWCSRCGGVIREGELFTREVEPASGLPLVRLCRGCVPFSRASGLLDTLLSPGSSEEPRPAATHVEAREKVLSRLGPALAAGRRKR
jgi:hypothetical protein